MSRKNINSGSYFEQSIGFSRAVRIDNLIAVSGTAPMADDGSTAYPGDAYRQAGTCFRRMQKAIEAAGGQLRQVIRTRVYLKHAGDWEAVARAHKEFFSDVHPACTFVTVKGFIDPQWLVEIEADCVL